MRVLLQVAVWELQALFAPGHIPPCIPQLTTEGGAAAGEEVEGEDGILGEGVVPDPEDHGHGVVAEVHGDQGTQEALGEVVSQAPEEAVGQAPEEAVNMEFLLEVVCLEVEYGAEEGEHREEEHGEEEHGEEEGEKHGEEEGHGEEVGLKTSGEET